MNNLPTAAKVVPALVIPLAITLGVTLPGIPFGVPAPVVIELPAVPQVNLPSKVLTPAGEFPAGMPSWIPQQPVFAANRMAAAAARKAAPKRALPRLQEAAERLADGDDGVVVEKLFDTGAAVNTVGVSAFLNEHEFGEGDLARLDW